MSDLVVVAVVKEFSRNYKLKKYMCLIDLERKSAHMNSQGGK